MPAAPAKAGDRHLAVAGGKLGHIFGNRVQVGSDLVWRKLSDCAARAVLPKLRAAAAARTRAGKKIRRNGYIACFGKLVSHAAHPIGQPENLVDDYDGRSLVFDFRVGDGAVHLSIAMFDFDPFDMAG